MDLINRGAYYVVALTALAMVICNQYGYRFDSPQMHLLMGLTIIPVSLILETMKLKPYFLYFPLWGLGFIPFLFGLYEIGDWPALFWAIPMAILCSLVLASSEKKREHKAIDVTHKLLDVDPDELRQQIADNRAHHSNQQKPQSR